MDKKRHARSALLGFVLICLSVGIVGGWFTQQSVHTWYPLLTKPFWNPPSFVFAPVWTVLYILMGVSIWLIWKASDDRPKGQAYRLFWMQLFLNFIWSGLFFTLKSPLLGLIDILLLLILITFTIGAFYRIRPLAAYLLVPYWIWVAYATTLNAAIWALN